MAWHLINISQTIDINPTAEGRSRIGAQGNAPLKLLGIAWEDGGADKGPKANAGDLMRYLVMSRDLIQPRWLEANEVVSMHPAWNP